VPMLVARRICSQRRLGLVAIRLLRVLALSLRILGSGSRHLGTLIQQLYDLLLFVPVWIETRMAMAAAEEAAADTGSFTEKNIIAKATFDDRPSTANRQKRAFASRVEKFIDETTPARALYRHHRWLVAGN
jgi:hypothetical protein